MSWEELCDTYANNGIFLALGAGVSAGSQLPNWRELLQRLLANHLDNEAVGIFEDFWNYGLSLPTIASLLEEKAGDRNRFIEQVREALYLDCPFYPNGITKSNRRSYVNYINESNPTLRSVASLCATRVPNRRTYQANDRIKAIVNFNLDALLQAYIYAKYEKRLVRTVERPSASSRPDKINVYHMHGYLRFDHKAGDRSKEAPDAAILTEQDYFDFFNQPTSLFNYTFLFLLREFSCLFIGLSMQDDNIRRLLHYSKRERLDAFVREGERRVSRDKLLRHFAVIKKSGKGHVDEAVEETLETLGTGVL